MLIKVNSKRQATLPAQILEALGVGPGDQIEVLKSPDGFVLRLRSRPQPRKIDFSRLGTLGDKIPEGLPPFDIRKFRDQREQGHGPSLRC